MGLGLLKKEVDLKVHFLFLVRFSMKKPPAMLVVGK